MGDLFDTTGFMPHGHCYLWRPTLVTLNVASDALTAAAYFIIPALMLKFLRARTDVPLRPVFVAFALFIISCGMTHVMHVITLWQPYYWASGAMKGLTALASVGTVALLVPALPRAIALPSPSQLRQVNDTLATAVTDLQLHHLVLDQMLLGVLLVRERDGVVVFANPRVERLLGASAGALVGRSARTLLMSPDDFARAFVDALGAHESEMQLTLRAVDDGAVWTVATMSSVHHPTHGAVRVARLRDRNEVERSLMADIVQSTSEAVVAVGANGAIRTWNRGAERLYGHTESEAVGRDFEALTGAAAQFPANERALVHEATHRTKDGRLRDVVVTVAPIRSLHGELVGISKIIHDVTDRRQAERALATSLREKEVLLQEVHHRVKNNLQLVSSLLSIQADAVTSDESRKAFFESQGRIRAIAQLHELLYRSSQLAEVPFDDYVRRLFQTVARAHQSPTGDAQLALDVPNFTVSVEQCVPLALILNELFVNAFKYGGPRGSATQRLSVRTTQHANRVHLEVSDNGPGLPADFSLETHAGVGLKLVQSLVGQLRGDFQHDSASGHTRWLLSFPHGGSAQ